MKRLTLFIFVVTTLAALVYVLWRLAQGPARETIDVPGAGRIQLATDEEREYWKGYYDGLAGDANDNVQR